MSKCVQLSVKLPELILTMYIVLSKHSHYYAAMYICM